jgi:hypothetical protein
MIRFLFYNKHVRGLDYGSYRLVESDYGLPDFIKRRKDILHYEETMLRMECFDMNLRHPHALVGKVVGKVWKGKEPEGGKVLDCAWCIANDT